MVRPAKRGRVASLHSDSYASFVRMLADRRKAAGLTQQDVADRLDWPQSFIAKIEKQERRVDAVELVQLAHAIGFDAGRLLRDLRAEMIKKGEIGG